MSALRIVIATSLLTVVAWGAPLAADGEIGNTLRGIVQAVRQASVSTDLFFRINRLPFREGQSFRMGDVLVAFDCGDLEAELKAANARLRGEQLTHENNQRLARLNAVGEYDVELQLAKVEQATAEVENLEIKLARCTIRAPFDGSIAELYVNEFEFPDRERPLMQIVDRSRLEIELLLPANWLQWLSPGEGFNIRIEETNVTHQAKVIRISPIVDPVSQTIKVVGRFTDDIKDVLPGMSGPAEFRVPDD